MVEYTKTGDLKQDILNVTKLLFNEYGYDKTTFQMVADTLQITKGAITYHYKNKHLIAFKIIKDFIFNIRAYVRKELNEDTDMYYRYCIVYFFLYNEVFKNQKYLDVFYNRAQLEQWSTNVVSIMTEYYVNIAKAYHKKTTLEQCKLNAMIDLGARMFFYNRFIEEPASFTAETIAESHLIMMGTLSRIDEISMYDDINRAKEFFKAHQNVRFDMFEIYDKELEPLEY